MRPLLETFFAASQRCLGAALASLVKTSDLVEALQHNSFLHPPYLHFHHPDFHHPAAEMEVLLGITGKDFTLIAASKAAMRGVTILKAEDDKTRLLSPHTLMAYSGEAGDTVQFAEYIQANVRLYGMRNNAGWQLSPSAVASFVRQELAKALRSRNPYTVNFLVGGFDTTTNKPHLYWLDYLASLTSVPYAAHGYAQYYCLSMLDKHHHPDISLEKGIELMRMCHAELIKRLPIDFKGLLVKVVTAKGVEVIEL